MKQNCENCIYLEADKEIINEQIEKIMQLEVELEKSDKPKSLAQYLGEYIEHKVVVMKPDTGKITALNMYEIYELFEQALDAYQSTENVTIKIERNK